MNDEKFKKYVEAIIKEVEKHKWYESEKTGWNIGGNNAALDWLAKHYEGWKKVHMSEFEDKK